MAAYCPPETVIASPQTFKTKTTLRQGERPFQTVKRFRLAEQKKNDDGARLMATYAKCRATTDEAIAKQNVELEKQRKRATSDILAGGI